MAQGGDLPPKPCSWGTLPICDERLAIQCQPRGPDPGWIQAVLPQDRIYGAGRAPEQAVLNAGDVTKAGMGRSCRARTPRGYFHARFAFCPALTCRFALAPTVPGLCTGPGRGARGLPSSSGDSPGAAAPLGAAGVGVKAPTSRGGCGASDNNVTRERGWLGGSHNTCDTEKLPWGSTGRCFGRAQLVPDMAGTAQAGSGQGRGGLAASPLARFAACPRCSPAAASQQGLIGTRDSFSRFPSPGSRHSLPGQAAQIRQGWLCQGCLPTRQTPTPEKNHSELGRWGVHSLSTPRQTPKHSFWGDASPLLPSPHPQLRRGDPALLGCPDRGAPAASSPRPPPSRTQTPALPDAHELFTYI